MKKVLILGASGMLGHAVSTEFANHEFDLTLTSRSQSKEFLPKVGEHIEFDALTDGLEKLKLDSFDYVINCIGIIKPKIHDDIQSEREAAILVNSLFPSRLATAAVKAGTRIIQIATDCVFSGADGDYSEVSLHDATDVYGKSKSLGEVPSPALMHLRVSTIGPEQGRSTLLLEWVKTQPQNAQITGFTDHLWNGITTKAFAKISASIVENDAYTPGTHHIVPADVVTKAQLVQMIAEAFGRSDLNVSPGVSSKPINRTLSTKNTQHNAQLWEQAGYSTPPTIAQLLAEISL